MKKKINEKKKELAEKNSKIEIWCISRAENCVNCKNITPKVALLLLYLTQYPLLLHFATALPLNSKNAIFLTKNSQKNVSILFPLPNKSSLRF